MNNRKKYIFYTFIISQLIIIILSMMLYRELTLLSYINIAFYLSFFFLLISLSIYTIRSGFFNTMIASFRRVGKFNRKAIVEDPYESITPYSELFSFSQFPILVIGILNGLACLVALIFYYCI